MEKLEFKKCNLNNEVETIMFMVKEKLLRSQNYHRMMVYAFVMNDHCE